MQKKIRLKIEEKAIEVMEKEIEKKEEKEAGYLEGHSLYLLGQYCGLECLLDQRDRPHCLRLSLILIWFFWSGSKSLMMVLLLMRMRPWASFLCSWSSAPLEKQLQSLVLKLLKKKSERQKTFSKRTCSLISSLWVSWMKMKKSGIDQKKKKRLEKEVRRR